MNFFDPPEPPDFSTSYSSEMFAQPEWMCAPSNYLPELVPVEFVLGRSDSAVVILSGIRVFQNSWNAMLISRQRPDTITQGWNDPSDFHPAMIQPGFMPPGMMPPGMPAPNLDAILKYGLQFADGSKVTNMTMFDGSAFNPDGGQPSGPMMMPGGGSGGMGEWSNELHIWPVPDEGDVTIACEWKDVGIELTETVLDGSLLRDAAARCEMLWDLPEPPANMGGGPVQVFID